MLFIKHVYSHERLTSPISGLDSVLRSERRTRWTSMREGSVRHSLAMIGLSLGGSMQTNCPASRLDVEGCAVRRLPVVVAAGLVVLVIFAAAVVVSDPFGLQAEMRGAESRLTEGFSSSGPTPDSGGGTVIATIPVGDYPFGVAYDSGNGYVYVANYNSNNVSIISGTTVVATIPVGGGPSGIAYDSGNGYVYVANLASNNTSVISGTTVLATVAVGNGPNGVAYNSAHGYVYVTNCYSNTVPVINGTSVVATIPVGNIPYGVAYDSGNGYIYVANINSNNVSVIDGTSVIASVPVGSGPDGVGYNGGNGYIYVANQNSNNVSVISGTTVVATVSVGGNPGGVGYDSGNGYVYVANHFSDNVSVIDGTTVVATIPVGSVPLGVAYENANGYVYVANALSDTVSVISTTAQLFLVTFTESGLPYGSPWSVTLDGLVNRSTTPTITFSEPNGTHAYAVGRVTGYAAYYYPSPSSGSVVVNGAPPSVVISFTANTKGGTVVATVPVGYYPVGAGYDAGNGHVYVANFVSNSVSVIDGTTVVATVPVGNNPHGVVYDSGNGYVYVANYNSNNVNGSNTVSVIDGTTIVATIPVGSNPDALAYDSQKGYVYLANYGSGNVSVISGNTVVAWIPVGEYPDALAYDSGNGCIYVARYYAGTVSVICTIAPPSAPSAPRNLTAVPGVGEGVLTWQTPASDRGAPITNYTGHPGPASGGETILTRMGDVGPRPATTVTNGFTYYYEVSAVNRFGVGSRSNEVAATPVPLPDSTAPSIRISSPLNNTIVSSTTVVVTGTASDNVAVQTVELSTDGTTWIAASGTTTWSGSVTLHAGTNVIYARATDTSGNRATVHIIVTVQNAGPGSSGLDPVILATILVAIGAVGFAAGLIVWKRGKPGRPPPGGPTLRPHPAP